MTIKGKMNISLPESFSPLDRSSRESMHFYGREPEMCMSDKDRYMLVIAGYQQLPLISRIMLKEGEVVRSMEKSCSLAMKDFNYKLQEFMSRQIGGKTASCFRYTYSAEEVPMEGESCFIRDGKLIYSLYVYYRKQLREESLTAWESILDSIKWANA